MTTTVLLCVSLLLLSAVAGIQWRTSLPDGKLLYACAGQDVQFAWSYTSGSGDVISSVKWTFHGRSEELMAVMVDANFLAMPAFANRVQHVQEAGLSLSHVTAGDSGNFTVEITGHDGSGISFTLRRTAVLQVSTDLMTSDHALHVQQELVAEYSHTTDQFHVVLSCGHFTFSGDPPYSVQWMTPQGSRLSTEYKDGYFRWFVPNPLQHNANYSCTIPQQSLPDACLHGNPSEVTVTLDAVQGRLAVLESQQRALQTDNQQLQWTLSAKEVVEGELITKVNHLQTQVSTLQTDKANFSRQMDVLQGVVQGLQSQTSGLVTENQHLRAELATVLSDAQELRAKVNYLQEQITNTHVAFHAEGLSFSTHTLLASPTAHPGSSSSISNGEKLVLGTTITNLGNAYDPTSGEFSAPRAGHYFFIASASTGETNNPAYLSLVVDGSPVSYCYSYQATHPQTGTCHVLLGLQAGQRVWLQAVGGGNRFWNERVYFSGFLLYV